MSGTGARGLGSEVGGRRPASHIPYYIEAQKSSGGVEKSEQMQK
jgi:hypothetical protein